MVVVRPSSFSSLLANSDDDVRLRHLTCGHKTVMAVGGTARQLTENRVANERLPPNEVADLGGTG